MLPSDAVGLLWQLMYTGNHHCLRILAHTDKRSRLSFRASFFLESSDFKEFASTWLQNG